MTFVEVLNKLSGYWKKIIKKLENTQLKLAKANWSARFNYVCLQEYVYICINQLLQIPGLIPNY